MSGAGELMRKVAVDSTLASSMEITPQLKREQLESYYQRRFPYYQKNHWVAVYPVSLLSSALTVHLTNKLGLLLLNYRVLLEQQVFSLRKVQIQLDNPTFYKIW